MNKSQKKRVMELIDSIKDDVVQSGGKGVTISNLTKLRSHIEKVQCDPNKFDSRDIDFVVLPNGNIDEVEDGKYSLSDLFNIRGFGTGFRSIECATEVSCWMRVYNLMLSLACFHNESGIPCGKWAVDYTYIDPEDGEEGMHWVTTSDLYPDSADYEMSCFLPACMFESHGAAKAAANYLNDNNIIPPNASEASNI